jgi:hypothetical protein
VVVRQPLFRAAQWGFMGVRLGNKARPHNTEGGVAAARGGEKGAWPGHRPGRGGGGRRAVQEQGREKGWLAGGPSIGVGPSWRWEGGYDRWAGAGKRKERKIKPNQFKFEIDTSNLLKLDSIQQDLPESRKFEIKYGWKVVEIKNNFPYRNFSRFEMEFE